MLNENIILLAQKLADGTASKEEIQQLNQWYDHWQDDEEIVNTYPNEDTEESVRMRMLMQIKNQMEQQQPSAKVIDIRRSWYRFAVAASIVLLLSAGAYLFINTNKKQQEIAANNTRQQDIAAPTASKAMITLADGRRVSLDSIQSGSLAKQHDVNVEKTADGQIVYSGSSTEMVYNTLDNPRGSKVQPITLSDGSKVWLNSESSLRYPVYFNGTERDVEVTGEAYFEVAKNAAMPFKVRVNGKETVQVLGTHFNINSYPDEAASTTTLLEGSVKIVSGANEKMLTPGQQAEVDAQAGITIHSNADIEMVMAWKNDRFKCKDSNLKSILAQVSRWYDVNIVYEDTIEEPFGGEISRSANLLQVLTILETTNKVKLTITGNTVTVKSITK